MEWGSMKCDADFPEIPGVILRPIDPAPVCKKF